MSKHSEARLLRFAGMALMTIAVFHYYRIQKERTVVNGLAMAQYDFMSSYQERCREECIALSARRQAMQCLGEAMQDIEGKVDSIVALKDYTILKQHVLAPGAKAFQGIQQAVKHVRVALQQNADMLKEADSTIGMQKELAERLCVRIKEYAEVFSPKPWYRSSGAFISIVLLLFGVFLFLASFEGIEAKEKKRN